MFTDISSSQQIFMRLMFCPVGAYELCSLGRTDRAKRLFLIKATQKLDEFTVTFTSETLFTVRKPRGHGGQIEAQTEEEGLSSCSLTASW